MDFVVEKEKGFEIVTVPTRTWYRLLAPGPETPSSHFDEEGEADSQGAQNDFLI